MAVPFDYYRIFFQVARYGNITTAARALFLSQPTVSKSIQNLESELGCCLFHRSKNGVTLTPEGELLYTQVAQACAHLAKAEEELESRKALQEGVVRIGASEMTLHHYLLPYLEEFRSRFPAVRLKIANLTTPSAMHSLDEGLIDFAVIMAPEEQSDLTITPLGSFQDMAIAGQQYGELKNRVVTLAELQQYPLICMESGTSSRRFLEQIFQEEKLTLRPDIELATVDLIVPMTAHNLGIGFVPREFAQPALEAGTVFALQLEKPLPVRQIALIQNPAQPVSLAGQAFLRLLREDPLGFGPHPVKTS